MISFAAVIKATVSSKELFAAAIEEDDVSRAVIISSLVNAKEFKLLLSVSLLTILLWRLVISG